MTAHIVSTGCAGFIESHLTDNLLADGQTVVGIDSFVQGHDCVLSLSMAGDDNRMLPKQR